jgi:DNA gyrase subunit B
VDGSHIRTLLLTFFFRQMAVLIERGYIYIAQPPLYKVKKGKQERYVKDDLELNSYLLQIAIDNAELHVDAVAPPISGVAIEELAKQYQQVIAITKRLGRRYNSLLLEKFISLPALGEGSFENGNVVAWFDEALSALNEEHGASRRFTSRAVQAAGEGVQSVIVSEWRHGIATDYSFNADFFNTAEYGLIRRLGEQLQGLIGDGGYIQRGERKREIESFKQALEWLLEEAKRGQHIQRYKGLGEMNPDQLWDTTMNPESRRLLQVTIEDAIAADEIFTTLMGDQVEPRREFIETNALYVENLDV